MAKISAALAIISVYIYLFGIMGTVESLDSSIEENAVSENENSVQETESEEMTIPIETTTASETERVIYTYSTELNVLNGKKPSLADYTATEAMLIITEAPASAQTTTTDDLVFGEDDFDYTTPKHTAPPETTPQTTVSPITTTTAASTLPITSATPETTVVQTTTTTTAPETTTTTTAEETTTTTTTEATTTTTETTTTEETTEEISLTNPPSWMDETDAADTTAETEASTPETVPTDEVLTVNAGGNIVTDNASVIIAKVVMAEVGDSFNEEAIKAQAVAAYTYIKYYNQNGQNAYVVFRAPSEKVTKCVNQVIGQGIYYDGKLIQAVYGASTPGYTASSLNVWGVDYPYLRSVKTDFDAAYDINYGRQATFTSAEIKTLVEKNSGIVLDGDPNGWFNITSRVDGAFVGSMTVGGQDSFGYNGKNLAITGRVFREIIMDYNIRSASFDISYDSQTDKFTVTTYGYGHGVGMSQHGANILASYQGCNYMQILQFYYQGTEIR